MKIKVTASKDVLYRIWNRDYANNSGKTLDCLRIDKDGWAICKNWKFPPHTYEVVK